MGTWPRDEALKELGTVSQAAVESDTEGSVLFMASTAGWSKEEVQVYIAHMRQAIRSGKYRPYYLQKVVWGRKPE